MARQNPRRVPRPFEMSSGKGSIVEEAWYKGRWHEPRIQLMEYEDGSQSIRFCYYDHSGRFQRGPLMVGMDDAAGLREALAETPRLRSLLKEIVD